MQPAIDQVLELWTVFEKAESNALVWLALLAVAASASWLLRADDLLGRRHRGHESSDETDPFGFHDTAREFDMQRYISSRDN